MFETNAFLNSYNNIDEHQAEYAMLLRLCEELNDMTFMLELEEIHGLLRKYDDIEKYIRGNYKSFDIRVFKFDHKREISMEIVCKESGMNKTQEWLYNQSLQRSKSNDSYVLARSNDTCVLIHNGEFDDGFKNQYVSRTDLNMAESRKYGIDQLEEVFEHFHINRKHQGCDYIIEGKVANSICEQQLRNHLFEYLKTNTKLYVQVEFCTSTDNDEESVDISLIDKNKAVAIIEVKFFVNGKLFVTRQSSKYTTARFRDGYEQLNKYCTHMSKDYIMHSAYLYMFYATDEDARDVMKTDRQIYNEFLSSDKVSEQFRRYYKNTIYDDMIDIVR